MIGSGFVSTYLAHKLRTSMEFSYCIIETNRPDESLLVFTKEKTDTVFSCQTAGKTIEILGGVDV
jgi:hypothetical protein